MTKRKMLRGLGYMLLGLSLLAVGGARPALAQKYPDRPVKIVIPLGPGGDGRANARRHQEVGRGDR